MPAVNPRLETLALATGIALAAPNVFAQSFDTVRLYGAAPGSDGGAFGAAVITSPEYRGSDARRTMLLPLLDYQWASGWFAGASNGIGFNFSGTPQMQYGLRVTADLGRKESRSSALRGMGDVPAALEGGGFFNYHLSRELLLTSTLRYGAGVGHKGLVVDLGAGYSTVIAPAWRLGAGAGLTFVNARYMQSFFGVTAGQSAASGYAVTTAGAGVRDVRVNTMLTYSIDPRLAVTTVLSASSLQGDAKDSPLTRKRTSATGVVAVTYAF